ncbi:hypothetical protein K493DRAFT_89726 [Basidiobolus meristosporus CBS 931.73]|uniref:Uncharacterized protein n=1 Tax=Basidiobolus meristosporus CBS 931.73 TaxID=1314790 RepID=A0A1Y1XCQ0_9FUNG|nr:hypothetical protein K493DRAFT_89726 [Basidiobolus meristosporus CBS 931.73]|eukprot:ORX83206.1 hypothetical protein K493DRAFT_89726 [Basidiobolus meristosporus CBS 931.73]
MSRQAHPMRIEVVSTKPLSTHSASKRMKKFLAENTAVHTLPNSVVYQLNEINRSIKKPSKKD